MSEIQHTSRAHARLNASSSHRWMMCPPSVRLSEQFEDKPSTYAEEGTYLHELCELKLHRYLGDMAMEAVEVQYAEHRDSEFYSDEAESVTDEYVAFCIETIEAVRSSCPDPLIMVEHRLDYSEYVPEGFGTGDLVIVADGVLDENGEPDSVGYDQIPQPDGTIRFYFEFAGREGGIERAESYDVILSIANWEVTPEGEWLREDPDNTWLKDEWVVTVTPEMKGEAQ